jgi:hypothetical protein
MICSAKSLTTSNKVFNPRDLTLSEDRNRFILCRLNWLSVTFPVLNNHCSYS